MEELNLVVVVLLHIDIPVVIITVQNYSLPFWNQIPPQAANVKIKH